MSNIPKERAQALCVKAGLEVNLPSDSFKNLKTAYTEGWLTDEDVDKAVLRVLTAKFKIGLFDAPFVDAQAAEKIVRCKEHKQLALEAARESIILLKNEEILPFCKEKIKKLAVFGTSANEFPIGKNYSGPYAREWTAPDAKTPLQYLEEYLGDSVEVIFAEDDSSQYQCGSGAVKRCSC